MLLNTICTKYLQRNITMYKFTWNQFTWDTVVKDQEDTKRCLDQRDSYDKYSRIRSINRAHERSDGQLEQLISHLASLEYVIDVLINKIQSLETELTKKTNTIEKRIEASVSTLLERPTVENWAKNWAKDVQDEKENVTKQIVK